MTSSHADKEIEIIHELGERVLEQETMLHQASDACGELDRSIIMHTASIYSLTVAAFSRLHRGLEITNSPDRT